jgi:PIN domain nuclease of toxin-antitoxin system
VKLLLDTHIWIWLHSRREKIGGKVRKQIENPANELYLSPISIWEARHLERTGRLRLKEPFDVWLHQALSNAPLKEAPFTFAVADEASGISLPQNDIGDVFLAATALVHKMTLVTADEQLIGCKWLNVMAN